MTAGPLKIAPFEVKVSGEAVADLRDRLAWTRWPDQIPGSEWAYGTDRWYLQRLCEYWRTGFDFALPLAWARDRFNLVHTARMARGGHFPALQVPGLFVDEVRTFFRDYGER